MKVIKVNKDLMSGMLSQHHNWYIQKDLCLVHLKFPTVIEALTAVCILSLLFKGSIYLIFLP